MSTAYCPADTTKLLQGSYDWSETEAELIQSLQCMYGGLGSRGECDVIDFVNASRSCNEIGQWEKADVSNCLSRVTVMLCDIRNVSTVEAVFVSPFKPT